MLALGTNLFPGSYSGIANIGGSNFGVTISFLRARIRQSVTIFQKLIARIMLYSLHLKTRHRGSIGSGGSGGWCGTTDGEEGGLLVHVHKNGLEITTCKPEKETPRLIYE